MAILLYASRSLPGGDRLRRSPGLVFQAFDEAVHDVLFFAQRACQSAIAASGRILAFTPRPLLLDLAGMLKAPKGKRVSVDKMNPWR